MGRIKDQTGLDVNVCKILARRGFEEGLALQEFLCPRLGGLLLPDLLPDWEPTLKRIIRAVDRKETIGVFGDYDMDGIGSAAIWTLFFRRLQLPHVTSIGRRNTGYGLDLDSVRQFKERGVSLIIACDVGSTDYESTELATNLGIDVIIIDHHQIEAPFPTAVAILNPKRPDSLFPFQGMATVGLTFYVIAGLRTRLLRDGWFSQSQLPDVKDYLDIVAMGTLADVAPLTGNNRLLVQFGITLLKQRKRVSLRALLDLVKLTEASSINEKAVVFKLVPKLNAAGRMGDPTLSLNFLLCPTYREALALAKQLGEVNRNRQTLQKMIYKEALEQASLSLDYRWSVVVSGAGWHQGIVGIVAAKLSEHFKRPAVVIGIDGERGRGSVRSHGDINIFSALEAAKEHLITFGGHHGAAGLEIRVSEIGNFALAFDRALKAHHSDEISRRVRVDCKLEFPELSPAFMQDLEQLAPFGNANPEPVFLSCGLEVTSVRYPRGVHLSLTLLDPVSKKRMRAIGFNMGDRAQDLKGEVDILYVLERDTFRGGDALQLRLLHVWSK